MKEESSVDDPVTSADVIGVRTRRSDRVQWATWAGDQLVKAGEWVGFADTAELGRVIVGSGMAIGVTRHDVHSRATPVVAMVPHAGEEPQSLGQTPWGRIGHRHWIGGNCTVEDARSAESTRYREFKTGMPALGSRFETDHGTGIVISSNVFEGTLAIRLDESSEVVEVRHRPPHSGGMIASETSTGSRESHG
jgi:hypothetical protein